MFWNILLYIFLLACLAITVFFCFPRVLRWAQDLFVEVAADLWIIVEDTVEEWKDLYKNLRGDK